MVASKSTGGGSSTPKRTPGRPPRAAKTKHKLIKSSASAGFKRPSPPTSTSKKKTAKIIRFTTDDYTWNCWQCLSAFADSAELADHLTTCTTRNAAEGDVTLSSGDTLPGCPFCPRDGCQAQHKPYFFEDFNAHLAAAHPDVKELACPYCTDGVESNRLEALTTHIINEHKVHWRPSPGES